VPPPVSVVVVNWNDRERLERCLRSLASAALDVVVVDNASDDGSADMVAREFPAVRLMRRSANDGFAVGVNAGVAASAMPFALVLNPDTEVAPPAVARLADTLTAHPRAGAVGGLLVDVANRPQAGFTVRRFPTLALFLVDLLLVDEIWPGNPATRRYLYSDLDLDGDVPVDVDQPAAACLLVRRAAFDAVGGFDEGFRPAWFEDVDFCRRLRSAGWRILLEPRARVIHEGGVSMRALGHVAFSRIWYRNLLRYVRKHHGAAGHALVRLALTVGLPLRAAALVLSGRRAEARACLAVVRGAWRDDPHATPVATAGPGDASTRTPPARWSG